MNTIHVIPLEDLKSHISNGKYCHCEPRIDDNLVIHNAYDGREFYEIDGIVDIDKDINKGWIVIENA